MPIEFIGDLSQADAEVLREMAETHSRIVEFGCGGSTQILSRYTSGTVISYDTDPNWIERTRPRVGDNVEFRKFSFDIPEHDFLFVDGLRSMRVPFAQAAIRSNHGCAAFHDTRKAIYTEPIMKLLYLHWNSIRQIDVNYRDSNITVIHFRPEPLEYVDWNREEGKTRAQIGLE